MRPPLDVMSIEILPLQAPSQMPNAIEDPPTHACENRALLALVHDVLKGMGLPSKRCWVMLLS